jgi:hypothetical protein
MALPPRGALYTHAMRRLPLLAVIVAFAIAGTVTAAPASESGPTATVAAKTPKLTKKQKKAKKSCLKRSSSHRCQLVKVVKKNGKRVGSYRCHKLTTDELLAEQDECANGQCAGTGEDDGEGDQPPIKL